MLAFVPLAALLVSAGADAQRTSVFVMPVVHTDDVSAATADIVQSVIAAELSRAPTLDVVSVTDVERMLSLNADRQLLGCASDDDACSMELGAALGARHLVTASLAKVQPTNMKSDFFVAQLGLLDAESARSIARERVLGRTPLELTERVRLAVERLASAFSGDEPQTLPPLVAARRMSDDSVLLGALVVGSSMASLALIGFAPFAVHGLASPFIGIPVFSEVIPFAALSLAPFVFFAGAGAASLLVDAFADEPRNFLRALLVSSVTAASAAVVMPLVLGGGYFASFLAFSLILGTPENDAQFTARIYLALASAGLTAPIAAAAIALVSAGTMMAGVGLFDDARVVEEGAAPPLEGAERASKDSVRSPMWFVSSAVNLEAE